MDPKELLSQKDVVDEVYGFIKIYSDGSVERPRFPGGYASANAEFVNGIASKDVTVDPGTGMCARIFLPESVATSHRRSPIVLHFHGGGLCCGTPAAASFHKFCSRMAIESESIWVSVDYRLAPEHRLPSAYDDAYTSFVWLNMQAEQAHEKSDNFQGLHGWDACRNGRLSDEHGLCVHGQEKAVGPCDKHILKDSSTCEHDHPPEPWISHYADFSECFLAGESSGGAIVHYLAMRLAQYKEPSRIKVQGLLIIHAAFLIEGIYDPSLDPRVERQADTYRRLCLPEGAAYDHPLVNPLHLDAPPLQSIVLPRSIIVVAELDKFCAPALKYVQVMKQCGHSVELHVTKGQGHCFYLYYPKRKESEMLFKHLVAFIRGRHSSL